MIPSLDAHAHLRLDLTRGGLDGLGSPAIMAVTRSPEEWPGALRRRDTRVAWGLGCHPGVARALSLYNEGLFAAVAKKAAFIGEVGLDARSSTPSDAQRRVFESILRVAAGEDLVISVHSLGHTAEVLDHLETSGAARVILHWWTGTAEETERAIRLGYHFSVNGAARPHILTQLPKDRVVTETDYPLSATIDPRANKPGRVDTIINLLAKSWSCDTSEVRATSWRAIKQLDSGRNRLALASPVFRSSIDAAHEPAGRPAPRSACDDAMSQVKTIKVDMSWIRDLNDEERAQFAQQAMDLSALFEPRDRHNVTGVFLNLGAVAMFIGPAVEGATGVSSLVPADWTTPDDQFRDDLGTIVAFILRLVDDPDTLPAVEAGWSSVMTDLKAQISAL